MASVLWGLALLSLCGPVPAQDSSTNAKTEFRSAEEAYRVGVAYYNSRNYKASRLPFEAAVRLAKDDAMRLKAYQALLPAYREVPEFEPFQTAAEYIIANSPQSAERSLTRRAFIAFAYNRGQIDNLVQRYEGMLNQEKNNYLAVSMLADLYTDAKRNPQRSIELLKQLEKLEAKKNPVAADQKSTDANKVRVAMEKGKLAQQYVQARDYRKAAKLYEEIAPLDPSTQAWNLKEAASAYLKDGNKREAARLAAAADAAPPESRNDLLVHFFHRNLGDIFMQLNQPKKAVPHFEIALEKTNIEGYVKDTRASLEEAKAKSK
jgi:hypothetical protein